MAKCRSSRTWPIRHAYLSYWISRKCARDSFVSANTPYQPAIQANVQCTSLWGKCFTSSRWPMEFIRLSVTATHVHRAEHMEKTTGAQTVLPEGAFEYVGTDILGPLSKTRQGTQHIVVMMNSRTNLMKVVSTQKTNTTAVAHIFYPTEQPMSVFRENYSLVKAHSTCLSSFWLPSVRSVWTILQ